MGGGGKGFHRGKKQCKGPEVLTEQQDSQCGLRGVSGVGREDEGGRSVCRALIGWARELRFNDRDSE
jgi:hypothetical protein